MTRHSLLLSLLSLFALLACDPKPATQPLPPTAESPAAVKAPEPPAEPAEERLTPLLWEIQGPNGPVYLFGTVHVGVDIDSLGYEIVRERFDKSTMFVMETDLSDAQEDMAKDMAIPADQPDLQEQLGPEAWKQLDARLGGAATTFKRMQAWVVTTMVIQKMIADLKAATPMDQELSARAQASKKELGYLEPASLQLALLKKHLTVEELKEMILEFDEQKVDLDKLIKAYKEADTEALTTLSFKDEARKPEMYEDMFYKRNSSWIPHIKTYIARGDVFVAFGAGHLVGPKGVLALLEAEGIKVKPIR